jgi:hypothetical protein
MQTTAATILRLHFAATIPRLHFAATIPRLHFAAITAAVLCDSWTRPSDGLTPELRRPKGNVVPPLTTTHT